MSFYLILLTLHNLNRWLIALFGLWTILQNLPLLSGNRPFTPAERRPLTMFMGSVHLQVGLGLLLFAIMGMQNIPVFAGAPRSAYTWEHLGTGVIAAIFATLGTIRSKRADTEQGKGRAALLWTVLSLLVMLVGMPWFRPLFRFFG